MRLTLDRAEALGLRSVRVTCDADIVGSIRVIEKSGGRLIGQVLSRTSGRIGRQYDISTLSTP